MNSLAPGNFNGHPPQNLLENITDGLLHISRDWIITYINPKAAHNGMKEPEELIGKNLWESYPSLRGTLWEAHYTNVMENGNHAQFEARSALRDVWYLVNVYPTPDGILVYWLDETVRKHYEEKIISIFKENQRHKVLLEAVFEVDPSGIAVLEGPDLVFTYNNPAYRFLTPELSDPLGKTYQQVWPNNNGKVDIERLKLVLEIGQPYQVTDVRHDFPDGSTRIYTLQARRIMWEDEQAILIALWDTTEIKRAEQEVHSLALFPEENPNPVLRLTGDGRILYMNPAANHLFPGNKVGQPILHTMQKPIQKAHQAGEVQAFDIQVKEKWFSFEIVPVKEAGYINLYGRDITERKKIEDRLLENEKRYQQLFRTTQAAIYEVDLNERRILSANDAMCQISGYSCEEILAMNPFDLLDEEGKALLQKRTVQWLAGDKPSPVAEYKIKAKDGHTIYALVNVTVLSDANGKPERAIVIAYDITDRKMMEQAPKKSPIN